MNNKFDYSRSQTGSFFLYMNGKYAGELEVPETVVIEIVNAYNNTYGRGLSPSIIDEMYVALKNAHNDLADAINFAKSLEKQVDTIQTKINNLIQ